MRRKFTFDRLKKEIKNNTEKYKNIKELLKEKEYDKIYELYGSETYCFFVPSKYQKKEIKRLLEEGRFYDIYLKYGESTYENYLPKMQAIDIYMETNKKNFFLKSKHYLNLKKKIMAMYTAGIVFLVNGVPVSISVAASANMHRNAEKYCEEISEYNRQIEKYAQDVKKLGLNDFQIVMKVIEDMWSSIKGYGNPTKDIVGFLRLDLMGEDGVGVCRNMADDVAAKLNVINPDYNARNLAVTGDWNVDYNLCNIERKVIENSTSTDDEEKANEQSNPIVDYILSSNAVGNHMVVLFDMPGEKVTMVADPTNPSLGVFKDGEIYMFSSPNGKGYIPATFGQNINGVDGIIDYGVSAINSFFSSGEVEELREKYGIEAENEALTEIHTIVASKTQPQKYSNNNTYHNSFTNDYDMEYSYGKSK